MGLVLRVYISSVHRFVFPVSFRRFLQTNAYLASYFLDQSVYHPRLTFPAFVLVGVGAAHSLNKKYSDPVQLFHHAERVPLYDSRVLRDGDQNILETFIHPSQNLCRVQLSSFVQGFPCS